MLPDLGVKHALLLQGPNGPFFRRFAGELQHHGIKVTKVNFNAGDGLFFRGPEAIAYRGKPDAWPAFLERLLRERGIDGIFVFGDGRRHHIEARQVAKQLDVPLFVFEEGYLRPDHITLERDGVNGNSSMPRDPAVFRNAVFTDKTPSIAHLGQTFRFSAWYATLYALAQTLTFGLLYPHYVHHRSIYAWGEMFRWLKSGIRKIRFERREATVVPELIASHDRRYFFVALQVHCDAQLTYSRFQSVEQFIEDVVASFAEHAPKDVKLVIKHHPMDRAYREYTPLMASLRTRHGLGDRLVYVHEVNLPQLLRHARGTVCINSTVGLQSVQYGTPTKTLGDAVYDMPGLTFQGSLEQFWQRPEPPDQELFRQFREWLLRVNQANGNFFKRLPGETRFTGVHWFRGLKASVSAQESATESAKNA